MSASRGTAAWSRLPARRAIWGRREQRRAHIIIGVGVVEVVRKVSSVGDVRGLVLVGLRAAS
eukprot:422132-Rhodomonas_salina.1